MTAQDHDDIVIELARLERRAFARVRERMASQQLGEAWIGLVVEDTLNEVPVGQPLPESILPLATG